MKSICIISISVVLISSCYSSDKNSGNSVETTKTAGAAGAGELIEMTETKLNQSKNPEITIEDIKGVYKCFMPYEAGGYDEETGILMGSIPNTYYEITFGANKEVTCSLWTMNPENTEKTGYSHEFSAKYEIKSKNEGVTELLVVYNPSYGEGPENIRIILNEKNNSLVYQGHSSTRHKNITLKKIK